MEYVYDIVLNFQKEYYEYYEWRKTDKIINVKRVPIYKVPINDYLNIKNHNVTIDKNTLPKQSKIFLITTGLEVMGIFINNNGGVIKKSSLIFEEADDILINKEKLKKVNIKYNIDHKNKLTYQTRTNKERMQYINNYLHRLDKKQDAYFLRYLYYDIYNIDLDDIDKIYDELIKLSKRDTTKLYDGIQKINLELKKSFD